MQAALLHKLSSEEDDDDVIVGRGVDNILSGRDESGQRVVPGTT